MNRGPGTLNAAYFVNSQWMMFHYIVVGNATVCDFMTSLNCSSPRFGELLSYYISGTLPTYCTFISIQKKLHALEFIIPTWVICSYQFDKNTVACLNLFHKQFPERGPYSIKSLLYTEVRLGWPRLIDVREHNHNSTDIVQYGPGQNLQSIHKMLTGVLWYVISGFSHMFHN